MWARRRPAMAALVAAMFAVPGSCGSSSRPCFAVRADSSPRAADAGREDETAPRTQADARARRSESRNAAARQAAGLLFDRGIEEARRGEPARALHLFVQALRALPADDPQAAAA